MKSTVPAGTGAAIRATCRGLAYVSCPEFLKEGSAVDDFMHPDRVVIGADAGDEWAADAVADVYEPLGGELVRTDVASAEMIKLASNAFLATKISFINEIANVSEEVGADVTEVARGMGLDQRIGPSFLRPGSATGAPAFPRTSGPQAARRQHRLPLPAAHRGDRGQRAAEAARVLKKLEKHLGSLVGKQDRAARPRVQAGHRRHARGVEPGARGAAAGRGRDGPRLRPGRRGGGAGSCCPRRVLRLRRGGARRRRRGGPGHRVARVRRARLGARSRGGWRTRC